MEFATYGKIETVFTRHPTTFKVMPACLRKPEFASLKRWLVTEKVDGTNVRVCLSTDGQVTYAGRTHRAQLPTRLFAYLQQTFTPEKLVAAFSDGEPWPNIVLFGEGYGPGIQKGGGNYRHDVAVRLFDVRIGDLWLKWEAVEDIAAKLGVKTVPVLGTMTLEATLALFAEPLPSRVAREDGGLGREAEGIVARSEPLLLDRFGRRVIWKLKRKDL